jgi:hypothetical protein
LGDPGSVDRPGDHDRRHAELSGSRGVISSSTRELRCGAA